MLRHIEPQAPLLGGASVDILQNWDRNSLLSHWPVDLILSASAGTVEKYVKNGHNNDTSRMNDQRSNNKRQRLD